MNGFNSGGPSVLIGDESMSVEELVSSSARSRVPQGNSDPFRDASATCV